MKPLVKLNRKSYIMFDTKGHNTKYSIFKQRRKRFLTPIKVTFPVILIWTMALTLLIMYIIYGTSEVVTICPSDWIIFNNQCYGFFHSLQTWNNASTLCKEYSANLATMTDLQINIIQRYLGDIKYWVGLRRIANEWKWVTDDLQGYNNPFIRGHGRYAIIYNRGLHGEFGGKYYFICSKFPIVIFKPFFANH
ncbi:c-type lectin domain containing [Murid herpesvirus 3]|uniref:C-type lectin domain containing n=2 Tax=Murid betaherpesvirus 3 TaxID=2560603 RepID=A0A1P8VIW3_9BETA|nr:c-type lectin domain containing [Murine roseolovirus]APZ76275.1 c-type lectin domain containing [Murid betaherpesvirus 3]AYH64790.1 c-type lectin domain containing [Murid herpesvirus 3]